MPDEQEGQAEQQPKGGQIGKQAADELSGKIHVDEQRKLNNESDENYDAQFQQQLVAKLKPEIEAFNEKAEFADTLDMHTESGMLQFFRDNKPAYALLIRNRQIHFLDPGSSTPVSSVQVTGGPYEYFFHGGSGSAAPMEDADVVKGLIRLAAGGKFQAE